MANRGWILRTLVLAVALFAAGCPAPAPVSRVWNWTFPVPALAASADTTIETVLYAGGAVRELALDLTLRGLDAAGAEVKIATLDRTELRVLRAGDLPEGSGTVRLPLVAGNALRLAVFAPRGAAWPQVTVDALTVRESPRGPEEGALLVAPGEMVDAFFAGPGAALFLRVVPRESTALDLIAFGAADLRVTDPDVDSYVLDPALALTAVTLDRAADGPHAPSGLVRIPAGRVATDRPLRVTWVAPDGAGAVPGHGRLLVAPVPTPGAKLAFPARARAAFVNQRFGVDHEADTFPRRACGFPQRGGDLRAKLQCVDWEGKTGRVDLPGTTGWWPRAPVVCYDTHTGTDFMLRGIGFGQAAGTEVTAAQGGVVVRAEDGNPDDCFYRPALDGGGEIRCRDVTLKHSLFDELPSVPETRANMVAVRQDDGLLAWYFHLRRGSVAVAPGQRLRCGDPIAQVGSSGDSAMPHLHFELRDLGATASLPSLALGGAMWCATDTVDPFPDKWVSWTPGTVPASTCP